MKRVNLLLSASLFGLMTVAANAQPATAPAHTVLGADLEALRSDFNAHADKVRAVLLVAPT